jgi:quercetin dioxygenase-like cupin family protein
MPFIDLNKKDKITVFPGITGPVAHSAQLSFGYFTLEEGTEVPMHQHVHEQWTHVLEGLLDFVIDDEKQVLQPGMAAYIPSNALHGAKAITHCRVIDCFTPVREAFVELEKGMKP